MSSLVKFLANRLSKFHLLLPPKPISMLWFRSFSGRWLSSHRCFWGTREIWRLRSSKGLANFRLLEGWHLYNLLSSIHWKALSCNPLGIRQKVEGRTSLWLSQFKKVTINCKDPIEVLLAWHDVLETLWKDSPNPWSFVAFFFIVWRLGFFLECNLMLMLLMALMRLLTVELLLIQSVLLLLAMTRLAGSLDLILETWSSLLNHC